MNNKISKLIRGTKEYTQVISDCREDCIGYRQGFSYGVESYSQEEVELITLKKIISNAEQLLAEQAKNKKLVVALEEIIDRECDNTCAIIALQALNEVNK